MKTILMSIQPKWCELISSGQKTIEVRKTAPKEVPFKVYIYCAKDKQGKIGKPYQNYKNIAIWKKNFCPPSFIAYGGKVIGEFICDKVDTILCASTDHRYFSKYGTCLTEEEIRDYCNGNDIFGLHITDIKIYDKPKEIGEFKSKQKLYLFGNKDYPIGNDYLPITRPPQSYMYCEPPKDLEV